MKAVGLITEYNPFHNGHSYHLQEAIKLSGADVSIAVMSGNFVQRGAPAFLDKYARSSAAVEAGVSLVVELPVYYALGSAELFADGAVRTLQSLGVKSIAFGSECGDISLLKQIAQIISEEPAWYQASLKTALASGKSFPAAREEAICSYFKNQKSEYSRLLSSPNNILGIEYIKAVIKHHYDIELYTIQRKGSGYNDRVITQELPSATALRTMLQSTDLSPDATFASMKELVPDAMYKILSENLNISYPIDINDFSVLLNYKISEIFHLCEFQKAMIAKQLCTYTDITPDLANRMISCFTGMDRFYEYAMKIKTRQYTFSRICRCLLHIILDMNHSKSKKYFQGNVPYIRILGFNKVGQQYLHQIKKICDIPIITKTSDYKDLLLEDIHASQIYNQIVQHKFGYTPTDEFRHGIYLKSEL